MKLADTATSAGVMNDWFAAFGLGETEDDHVTFPADESDDTAMYDEEEDNASYLPRTTRGSSKKSLPRNDQQEQHRSPRCHPSNCRLHSGICVDCTNCLKHCDCGDVTVVPPTCDTKHCSERICPGCMRCVNHCLCQCSSYRRCSSFFVAFSPTSSPTQPEPRNLQDNNKKSITEMLSLPPFLSRVEPKEDDDDDSSNIRSAFQFGRRCGSSVVNYDSDEEENVPNRNKDRRQQEQPKLAAITEVLSTEDNEENIGTSNSNKNENTFEVVFSGLTFSNKSINSPSRSRRIEEHENAWQRSQRSEVSSLAEI